MRPKVGVCVPVVDAILPAVYFNHITVIAHWSKSYEITVLGVQRFKVAASRKILTKEAIAHGCKHALWLDSDHIVQLNMLDLFMENADAAEVSGLIVKRKYPYNTVAFIRDEKGEIMDAQLKPNTGVHEVDVCAMGCTLLNLELLQKLSQPWWYDGHFRSDINLGLKFKDELGSEAKILVDTRVITGHLADPIVIYPEHADTLRRIHIEELIHDLEKNDN